MRLLLMESAVRAVLIAAGTAAVLYILRVKSARARHVAWASVMALMLLLPVWTAWGPKAFVRWLPAVTAADAAARPTVPGQVLSREKPQASSSLELATDQGEIRVWNWRIGLGVYLLGVCVLLARLAVGTARAHLLVRSASNHEGKLTSSSCAAPITVGWLHPIVILPESWPRWPQAQLDAVLTHESEHARRRDPLVQWLALLNRAVFWYHPLAWWLERRLSALAEEACDAAVLARGHSPHDYSGYLLALARAVVRTGARVNVWGMAMPGSFLPTRIRQILEGRPAPRMTRVRMICAAAACAIVSSVFAAGTLDHQKAPVIVASVPPVTVQERPSMAVSTPPLPKPRDTRFKPAPRSVPLLAQAQSNSSPASPAPPQKDRRLLALYFDMTSMTPADLTRVVAASQQFIRLRMQPEDLVAVVTFSEGTVQIKQDFIGDKDRLLQVIDQLTGAKGTDNPDVSTGDPSLTGLRMAIEKLGAITGRKALIYFAIPRASNGLPDWKPLNDAAVRAGIAVYTIDVRGLVVAR